MTNEWTTQIAAWELHLRAAGRSEGTIRTRAEHARWLATWAGPRGPWTLTTEDLESWMGERTWARETRRGVRGTMRSLYGWAETTGRVTASPAHDLAPIKPSQPKPRPAPESVYAAALLAATPRERLILRLAAECGLRRAEVAVIHSDDLLEDLTGWSLVVHGKGSRDRVVPLPPGLARDLQDAPGGWLFPGRDGGHLSPRWVGKIVTRLLDGPHTMHALRHRFATRAYAVSSDLLTVQQLLGHASPTTTQLYVAVPDAARRALVLAVAAA